MGVDLEADGVEVAVSGLAPVEEPRKQGLREWAMGELNHLTTPVNTGLQAADPLVRPV